MNNPGSFHATRAHPETAGLGASLHHVSGWPALSITASPQTLELELVNRMPHPLQAGPGRLRLAFRPGILTDLHGIVLAPQSEAAWSLALADDPHGNVVLEFAGVEAFRLEPGEATAIRLDGVSAAAAGGSRATRVQLRYAGFFLDSGVEVAGSRLLHLSVLRRHEPPGLPATEIRTGSTAASGPFLAGFLNGPDVLNDGKSVNTLRLRIVNTSGRPIRLSDESDEATRLYISFRTGEPGQEWGLLGSHTDHVTLAVKQSGWQIDNHTLRRNAPGTWGPRDALDIELTVHTTARSGDAQLVLTYENLPAHDDGDLVLLVHVGPVASRDHALVSVTPIELRGSEARLRFHAAEETGGKETTPAPFISVSREAATAGRLDVTAPAGMRIEGELDITGAIRGGGIAPSTFKLGGRLDRYYPVVFEDLGWDRGELRLEVFRTGAHIDGVGDEWRGSMMAKILCHSSNFGHGSDYASIEVRQSSASGLPNRHFIGGFENYGRAPRHVLWLAGDTTYWWFASHPARIDAVTVLHAPGAVRVGSGSTEQEYPVKSAPEPAFDADYVSISRTFDRDSSPVPVGAIMLWPRSDPAVPMGWAICDGSKGTPDLKSEFPPSLVYIRKR
jgi:hypothetical protein